MKDAGYLRYANVGGKMDAGNENIGKIKAAWMGSNSSFQGKEQGEWRGGEGKKRWKLRWRESSANKKRWGWLDRKCDACVSKCTQRVGQTNLICDERAVQPPSPSPGTLLHSVCARYLQVANFLVIAAVSFRVVVGPRLETGHS